ncbi:hypothetical protein F5887DRAFT_917870 [Amanita rubescens]|nr:hypothetical protein F5887DRAFT_917870 [Amanita rubescens]
MVTSAGYEQTSKLLLTSTITRRFNAGVEKTQFSASLIREKTILQASSIVIIIQLQDGVIVILEDEKKNEAKGKNNNMYSAMLNPQLRYSILLVLEMICVNWANDSQRKDSQEGERRGGWSHSRWWLVALETPHPDSLKKRSGLGPAARSGGPYLPSRRSLSFSASAHHCPRNECGSSSPLHRTSPAHAIILRHLRRRDTKKDNKNSEGGRSSESHGGNESDESERWQHGRNGAR